MPDVHVTFVGFAVVYTHIVRPKLSFIECYVSGEHGSGKGLLQVKGQDILVCWFGLAILHVTVGEPFQLSGGGVTAHPLTESSPPNHFLRRSSLCTRHMYDMYQTLDCKEIKK